MILANSDCKPEKKYKALGHLGIGELKHRIQQYELIGFFYFPETPIGGRDEYSGCFFTSQTHQDDFEHRPYLYKHEAEMILKNPRLGSTRVIEARDALDYIQLKELYEEIESFEKAA